MIINAFLNLILYALALGILYWLVIWLIDTIPVPDPPARFIKIIMVVIAVFVIISLLLNLAGVGMEGMPRLNLT